MPTTDQSEGAGVTPAPAAPNDKYGKAAGDAVSPDVMLFLSKYPEFDNPTIEHAAIQFWWDNSAVLLNKCRLGERYELARLLMTAHNVLVMNPYAKLLRGGALVAGFTGLVASKSVDRVSVSYDNQTGAMRDGENYNLTPYGQMLWRILRATGSGPLYVPYLTPAMRDSYHRHIFLSTNPCGCADATVEALAVEPAEAIAAVDTPKQSK